MVKLITIVFFLTPGMLFAQKADSVKHSTIRSLTDEQYTAIANGDDVYNAANVALINHFPLPDQVLKFRRELNLSPIQVNQLNDILKTLKLKKMEVGISVIRNERVLDSLFRTRKLNEGSIIFYTTRYGSYQGEYRGALLMACYSTRKLLTTMQLDKFYQLQNHN